MSAGALLRAAGIAIAAASPAAQARPKQQAAPVPQSQSTVQPSSADSARNTPDFIRLGLIRGATPQPVPADSPKEQCREIANNSGAIAYAQKTDSDALLVWRAGNLVVNEYFPPYSSDSRVWSASMAKTVVALLVGIAIDNGEIKSVDQPVSDYLTEWQDNTHQTIRFKDLLEMTSGLDHPPIESLAGKALIRSTNVLAAAAALPVVDKPGEKFDYNTANIVLLMEALSRAVHGSFADYLSEKLWIPLGEADASMAEDRTGHAMPSIYATASDWLKIGILIEQRGRVRSRQIVPAAWIDRMIAPSPHNSNYGWLIWRGSPPGKHRSYGPYIKFEALHSAPFSANDVVYLDGFGGQRVYVIRSRKTVIVRTGASDFGWDDAILPNAVLKSSRIPGSKYQRSKP